jgi:curved DNA-binding protein CbpA
MDLDFLMASADDESARQEGRTAASRRREEPVTGWPGHPHGGDPYQVLGVGPGASHEEIARAYRLKARQSHPDAHPGDPQAAARFRALTGAYDMLGDPARRDAYDRRHPARVTPPVPSSPPAGWPVRADTAPLRAGPVRVEPPGGAPAARDPGRAGSLDARLLLAALLSDYLTSRWGWPADRDWPW